MLHRMNVEEMPAEAGVMSLDRWTGSYRDPYNDIWVLRRSGRKQWEVAERAAGNRTVVHGRHRLLERALEAANALHGRQISKFAA